MAADPLSDVHLPKPRALANDALEFRIRISVTTFIMPFTKCGEAKHGLTWIVHDCSP